MNTKQSDFSTWTQDNKHTLRNLYAGFLKDMGYTFDEWARGMAPSYSSFCNTMWKNCK